MPPTSQPAVDGFLDIGPPSTGPGGDPASPFATSIAGAGDASGTATTPVSRRALHGFAWLVAQTSVSRVVQSFAQVVMAWLLSPSDFGTISIVFTVSTLIGALFQFGLDDVLLRRNLAMAMWFRTVSWLSLIFGVLSAVVLLCVAPLAALLYHEPRLVPLIGIMAFGAPLGALSVVPQAILRSRLRFQALSMVTFGEVVLTSLLAIALAAGGAGPYSFVVPLPLSSACRAAVLWRIAKPPAGRVRWAKRWRKLLPSASAVLGSRLLVQMIGQGDYIVFGLTATATQVGLYYFAFRIAGQPIRLMAGSLTGVLLPTLTQFKQDQPRQRRAVILSSQILALIVMPLCFTQAAMAEPVMAQFFDPRWAGATLFIQMLSVALAFDAVSWTVGTLLPARGEFTAALSYSAAMAAVFLTAILVGALSDRTFGVPVAVVVYYIGAQPAFCYFVLRRSDHISLPFFFGIYAMPAVVAGISVLLAVASVQFIHSQVAKIIIIPSLSLPLYTVAIWYLSPGPCRSLLGQFRSMIGPRQHPGL